MSDNFIPLNQSTPVRSKWQHGRNNQGGYSNNRFQNSGNRRGGYNNRRGNNSRNSSHGHGSDGNSSFGQDNKINIDAYLHPSMLQDPWASLRQSNN